jgi:hypothetical protein
MVAPFRAVHPSNAESPIVFTLLGMVKDFSAPQFFNALLAIFVVPPGTAKCPLLFTLVHPSDVTLLGRAEKSKQRSQTISIFWA